MRLGLLYHWSPASRHYEIKDQGLVPGSTPTVASVPLDYVCLGFSPSGAWAISGQTYPDVVAWDLWQVQLADDDNVTVRPEFGPVLCELMVHNKIGPDRMWWVARRAGREAT